MTDARSTSETKALNREGFFMWGKIPGLFFLCVISVLVYADIGEDAGITRTRYAFFYVESANTERGKPP